jgi:hypothetical protein
MNEEQVQVYMLPNDAKLFLEFQRYYDIFNLLVEKKVFEQKGAAVTLHFDNKGFLKTITRADVLYLSTVNFTNTN